MDENVGAWLSASKPPSYMIQKKTKTTKSNKRYSPLSHRLPPRRMLMSTSLLSCHLNDSPPPPELVKNTKQSNLLSYFCQNKQTTHNQENKSDPEACIETDQSGHHVIDDHIQESKHENNWSAKQKTKHGSQFGFSSPSSDNNLYTTSTKSKDPIEDTYVTDSLNNSAVVRRREISIQNGEDLHKGDNSSTKKPNMCSAVVIRTSATPLVTEHETQLELRSANLSNSSKSLQYGASSPAASSHSILNSVSGAYGHSQNHKNPHINTAEPLDLDGRFQVPKLSHDADLSLTLNKKNDSEKSCNSALFCELDNLDAIPKETTHLSKNRSTTNEKENYKTLSLNFNSNSSSISLTSASECQSFDKDFDRKREHVCKNVSKISSSTCACDEGIDFNSPNVSQVESSGSDMDTFTLRSLRSQNSESEQRTLSLKVSDNSLKSLCFSQLECSAQQRRPPVGNDYSLVEETFEGRKQKYMKEMGSLVFTEITEGEQEMSQMF